MPPTNHDENPEPETDSHREEDARGALIPLRRLVELALAHPDIGPPLADLAYAIGQKDVGDQLVRLGTERDRPRVEYFVIAGYAARRSRRHADVFRATLDALRALAEHEPAPEDPDEGSRVLQLVRTALSVLMFDLKDLAREPEFTSGLAERLRLLEDRLGGEVLYRTLYAQALWFNDKDASERQWERARELAGATGNAQGIEAVWNARGTWAKEADRDLDKAERLYRRGLEAIPESALLLHNLAQVLVERAEHAAPSPGAARHLLNQAQDLLRRTLRADVPRLRRHIHATRDRLEAVRRTLPRPEVPKEHQEAPRPIEAPPPPPPASTAPPAPRPQQQQQQRPPDRGPRRGPNPNPPPPRNDPGQAFLRTGTVTLGDLIKAKLETKKKPEG
jgi:tetratricopeptide (TPR) repeat protein